VPYTERNAMKERDALNKLTGSVDVPVLIVGSRTLKGYLATDWDGALDSAGYPRAAPPGMKAQAQANAATPKVPAPKGEAQTGQAPTGQAPRSEAPKAEAPRPTARQP
jgi:hypothetical protein